ncbi:MAG: SDR family NAD(P)-dependent oxidoreductase [Bacillota bacterium]
MGLLEGKVAIVTGAGRGIGRGEAMLLAKEGAKVIVNDLGGSWDGIGEDSRPAVQVVEEIRAAGGISEPNFSDVADWNSSKAMIQQAIDTWGKLDILVCNAGILRDRMIFNMSEDEWDAIMKVHLKGHFAPTRHAAAYWREVSKTSGKPAGGHIVMTSSASGLYSNFGQSNYAAAKIGIAHFGITVAKEVAKYGVNCNIICPNARTRLTETTFGSAAFGFEGSFDIYHPDNIAPWVVYLCTDEASHVNGQVFEVFGGQVTLNQGWHVVHEINKDERWTVSELIGKSKDLFGDIPSSVAASQMAPDNTPSQG